MSTIINKNHKDTVFRMIFAEAENALSLYNGLSGNNYTDISQLEYNTLENAIYMNVKNDVSFIICDNLNFYEHQSTWTPNMPLRDLIYITSVYQNYIENKQDKSIYGSSIIRLPSPNFMVFYNGTAEYPEYKELRLSDAFMGLKGEPALELIVRVFNINKGMNEELKKKCPILAEYSKYVELVRSFTKIMPLENAVKKAVEECINNNILKDFLLRQKAEVVKMSIFEYDEEKEMKRIRNSERAYGVEIGKNIGFEEGNNVGIIIGTIKTYAECGVSKADIIIKIMEKFSLSHEKAEQLVEEYLN